jgi:alpha-1,3-glucan synthase
MGDLLGFEGYMNESAPFWPNEHKVAWKSSRRYLDFDVGTNYNNTCEFPRFWNETGYPVDAWVNAQFQGCYDSDFDQVRFLVFSHLSGPCRHIWRLLMYK